MKKHSEPISPRGVAPLPTPASQYMAATPKSSLSVKNIFEILESNEPSLVKIDGDLVIIRKFLNQKHIYEIELYRIDTAEKLLGWIGQLVGKAWITRRHIYDLIDVVEQNGVKIRRNI